MKRHKQPALSYTFSDSRRNHNFATAGFYLNIISETAFEIDTLPLISLEEGIGFLWNIIKPFLIFSLTLLVVLIPFFITLSLLQDKGITITNMWRAEFGLRLLLQVLFILGLFFFPMAILTTALGRDITLLRPDYILTPIIKAFFPYLVTVVLLVIAVVIELNTRQFAGVEEETFFSTAGKLAVNLAVQLFAVIAMRSIGLFYRHYTCYFRW